MPTCTGSEGGFFQAEMSFPEDYPNMPPKLIITSDFCTRRASCRQPKAVIPAPEGHGLKATASRPRAKGRARATSARVFCLPPHVSLCFVDIDVRQARGAQGIRTFTAMDGSVSPFCMPPGTTLLAMRAPPNAGCLCTRSSPS